MMRINSFILTIAVFAFSFKGNGQEDHIVNQAKFLQKSNASFFGMNQLNRVGVLYNSLKINEATSMDNKYAFGAISFQDKNFTIGVDVNSFSLDEIGLSSSLASLNYVYKI